MSLKMRQCPYELIAIYTSIETSIMTDLNITVLISGNGSNLQALIDAAAKNKLNGTITQVILSKAGVFGLERAEKAKIPTKVHSLAKYYKGTTKDDKEKRTELRNEFNLQLADILIESSPKPQLVVCAGWMLILSKPMLDKLDAAGIAIINLHPALPKMFDGVNAIERSYEAGKKGEVQHSGVMIHRVEPIVDGGRVVLTKRLDFIKDESLDEYTQRVHDLEHIAIVEGTNVVCDEIKDESKDESKEVISSLEKLDITKV